MDGLHELPGFRWRDTYLRRIEDLVRICVLTRTGDEEYDQFNKILRTHPLYVSDRTLETDSTYREFVFQTPSLDEENESDYVKSIEPIVRDSVEHLGKQEEFKAAGEMEMLFQEDPDIRWKKFFSDLESEKDTEETRRALDTGKKIFEAIEKGSEGDGPIIIET